MCLVQMLFHKLNSIKHTLQYFTLSAILAYLLVLTKKKKKTDMYENVWFNWRKKKKKSEQVPGVTL